MDKEKIPPMPVKHIRLDVGTYAKLSSIAHCGQSIRGVIVELYDFYVENNHRVSTRSEQVKWKRELSGHNTIAKCQCPHCGLVYKTPMPVEFANDTTIERIDGNIVLLCGVCD